MVVGGFENEHMVHTHDCCSSGADGCTVVDVDDGVAEDDEENRSAA